MLEAIVRSGTQTNREDPKGGIQVRYQKAATVGAHGGTALLLGPQLACFKNIACLTL